MSNRAPLVGGKRGKRRRWFVYCFFFCLCLGLCLGLACGLSSYSAPCCCLVCLHTVFFRSCVFVYVHNTQHSLVESIDSNRNTKINTSKYVRLLILFSMNVVCGFIGFICQRAAIGRGEPPRSEFTVEWEWRARPGRGEYNRGI